MRDGCMGPVRESVTQVGHSAEGRAAFAAFVRLCVQEITMRGSAIRRCPTSSDITRLASLVERATRLT